MSSPRSRRPNTRSARRRLPSSARSTPMRRPPTRLRRPRCKNLRRSSSWASRSRPWARRATRRRADLVSEPAAQEGQETFLSHLIELRERLVRSLLAIAVLCVPALYFSSELYDLLALPLIESLPQGSKMIATGVITPFLIPMKIALVTAFVGALPYVLYQAWAFVAPGLYVHEKRLVLPLIVSSTVLFLVGMAFCYFIVFGGVFQFITTFAPKSLSVL